MTKAELSAGEARRIALSAQGFARARPEGRIDVRHLRRVMTHVNVVQLDSVNVVVRSHYLPFFSRLGVYPVQLLDDLAFRRRELFEYWGHAASLLPIEHYPLMRHRMAAARPRQREAELMRDQPGYVESVLDEVRERGPLAVAELTDPGERSGPWWGHGKGKIALDWHFMTGAVATHERRGFTRVYDLAERVIPDRVRGAGSPAAPEAHRALLLLAARSHGVATASDLAGYYPAPTAGAAKLTVPFTRRRLEELADEGRLERVSVEGWREPAYLHPAATLPRRVVGRALLSPFDSLIWDRDRMSRVFGFDYKIEIYVPASQRRYGYYVLPFLLDGELVARVDLKAQRDAGTLRVQAAHIEDGRNPSHAAAELAAELRLMADWLGLERVRAERRGNLARELRAALA